MVSSSGLFVLAPEAAFRVRVVGFYRDGWV